MGSSEVHPAPFGPRDDQSVRRMLECRYGISKARRTPQQLERQDRKSSSSGPQPSRQDCGPWVGSQSKYPSDQYHRDKRVRRYRPNPNGHQGPYEDGKDQWYAGQVSVAPFFRVFFHIQISGKKVLLPNLQPLSS